MEKKRITFLGAYFSKETILRLASLARVFSWVVVGIYAAQWVVQCATIVLQIARGFWVGLGVTDYATSFILLFEQPLRGVVYFIVLQALAQALLLFMDMEENTRRAARNSPANKP